MPNTSGVELSGISRSSRVHDSPACRDLSTNSGRAHGESGETCPKPQSQRKTPAKPTRDKSCKLRNEVFLSLRRGAEQVQVPKEIQAETRFPGGPAGPPQPFRGGNAARTRNV